MLLSSRRTVIHALRVAAPAVFLVALVPAAPFHHTTGLTHQVEVGGVNIGEMRLHVGTHNFQPDGNEGIGKATPNGEDSAFYPANGQTLAQAAAAIGVHHLTWAQVVKDQPAAHDDTFGDTPHMDPSSDPDNPTPRDNHPWYLNENNAGTTPDPPINPPFDLPPDTDTKLVFQDFRSGGFQPGECIEFCTYLVAVVDPVDRLYQIIEGFRWKNTFEVVPGEQNPRLHVTALERVSTAPDQIPDEHYDLIEDYGNKGWTPVRICVPAMDPPRTYAFGLLLLAAAGLFLRSRRARA